ncbi:MAG: hypothetical protein D3910_29220 [Candidatus Electrothrix sp. ATG2]|nr:hypothetical protein [Candidatus Electrothrix sp. ATG2]
MKGEDVKYKTVGPAAKRYCFFREEYGTMILLLLVGRYCSGQRDGMFVSPQGGEMGVYMKVQATPWSHPNNFHVLLSLLRGEGWKVIKKE